MQSEQVNELALALCKAQLEFKPVEKGSVNPFFKSKYADLADVMQAALPILNKHGLSVVQTHDGDSLVTTLMHTSGQWVRGTIQLINPKSDMQGLGSATTYARRYGFMPIVGLVADEDDDGNSVQRAQRPKSTTRDEQSWGPRSDGGASPDQRNLISSLVRQGKIKSIDKQSWAKLTFEDADKLIKSAKQ